MDRIETLVNPKSVAVIGASADPAKIGYQILHNLVEGKFSGKIFPINPKAEEILSLKAFPEITSVGEPVDLAVIVVPGQFVIPVLKQCAESKVKSVIVISAGFAETGTEGKKIQDEMVSICRDAGITMLGPNCLGLLNTHANLNASFAQSMPKKGNISLVSQSGAMITALIDWSASSTEGFAKIFSMGNKADINEEDVLEYLYNDDETDVIIAYLEQLNVTPELTNLLSKHSKRKPTVVLFGGKTSFGAKAASSHTGSLISSYLAVETYLKQSGAIIANNLSELFILCQLFSNERKIEDNGIAVITNAGGPGIATCDDLYSKGLDLARLSDATRTELSEKCRPMTNTSNPVDVLGDGTEIDYKQALEIVSRDENVHGVIILLTPQSSTNIQATASVIAEFKNTKPVVCAFIGGEQLADARHAIEKSGKPCFRSPDEAVVAMNALVQFNQNESAILTSSPENNHFDMEKKTEILKGFDLPVLEYFEASTVDELKNLAQKIGYPVVLKTAKKEIIHKSDSGGVKLDIKNESELEQFFAELGSPVIIGKMVKGKKEIFLGIKKDPNIGTLVAFGTGGIYSEIYKDISYRVAPLTAEIAEKMINETKMGQILNGARGQEKYDLKKLAEVIVNAARFADTYENIKEIDFNPLIAEYPNFYIVDVRIIEK